MRDGPGRWLEDGQPRVAVPRAAGAGHAIGPWRRWWLGAAGRDPWHEASAATSLRRSLSLVTAGTAVAMLAAFASLAFTLDVVVPGLGSTPPATAVDIVRGLLVLDAAACIGVLTLLQRERGRLDVLGSHLATERVRAEDARSGVALQAEHMRVVLGVAERLAGNVSVEDIAAVVIGAARTISGAPAATLWLVGEGGSLVPAGAPAYGPGAPTRAPATQGWATSLLSNGEVVGVLEVVGVRHPPVPVTTVLEALAAHAAGAIEVTQRYAMLRQASFVDALTGLPNRGALDIALRTECERAARTGTELAVVMIDIDHFKQYNDTHGHQEGDAAVRGVARALAKGLRRRGDGAYRYGGEEFTLVLPGTDGPSGVAVADRLRAAVADAVDAGMMTFAVTASFGVACSHGAGTSPAALLAAADAALYRAKEGGRNRVELAPAH